MQKDVENKILNEENKKLEKKLRKLKKEKLMDKAKIEFLEKHMPLHEFIKGTDEDTNK